MKKRTLALLTLTLLLIFTLGGCSGARRVRGVVPAAATLAESDRYLTSTRPREDQQRISRTDMTVLYFDDESSSICVYDAGAKLLWRALPETKTDNAAMLRLRVLAGKTLVTLSSQTDAAAQGRTTYETQDGTLRVTYDFLRELDEKTTIHFNVPLVFTAENGTMQVEIDCAALRQRDCSADVTLLSMEVLPSFGALSKQTKDGFLFVPDGCGGVLSTKAAPLEAPLTLPVYGDPNRPSLPAAAIAAYGVCAGEGAFVALAEDADALATVTATDTPLYAVGTTFAMTPEKQDGESISVGGASYDGKIKLSYRFLSQDAATVAGMASACRELLMRNGTLDLAAMRESRTALPLHLTLIGSERFAVPGRGSYVARHTTTTLPQAQDILTLLRGKGVTNIDLCYRGLLQGDGGSGALRVRGAVGGSSSLADFIEAAEGLNTRVYPAASFFTAAQSGGHAAHTPDGKAQTATVQTLSGSRISVETTLTLRKRTPSLARMLRAVRKTPCTGLALTDVGTLLAFDGAENRQTLKERLQNQLAALFAAKPMLVTGGNLFALKYAAAVTELPHDTAYTADGYTPAPFLQMLLHGYTDYSGGALNLAADEETAFLKAAEYGETLACTWYYNDYGNENTPDDCHYQQSAGMVQQYYERLNAVFADLSGKRITAHMEAAPGVFATTFGTTTVYVNYNDTDVTVHGVTVEGRNLLRVN